MVPVLTLVEALKRVNKHRRSEGTPVLVSLVTGYTPLHLGTYFWAHLRSPNPDTPLRVEVGRYGDLLGTLERLPATHQHVAIALEWADLDPRLGLRTLGEWSATMQVDLVTLVNQTLNSLSERLQWCISTRSVTLSLPTLPLPPVFYTPESRTSVEEQAIRSAVAEWGLQMVAAGVALVNEQSLAMSSPIGTRHDVDGELRYGFPYHLAHAERLGASLAELVFPTPPKKGLVTDLDNTLWRGIVGEVGCAGVEWDLDNGAQLHGLYQQLLRSFSETGILVGVASKNDPAPVQEALRRSDIQIGERSLYPIITTWGPKSESLRQILHTWNIGPEDVVVVDDSAAELAEMSSIYPDATYRLFPTNDATATVDLFRGLRELFGRHSLHQEDLLRGTSIRTIQDTNRMPESFERHEEFLRTLNGRVTISLDRSDRDGRLLSLINKTNQFNLNGRRLTRVEWEEMLQRPGAFCVTASYADKFGPLGRIAVIAGQVRGECAAVDVWVMSCRAFSRRIEYQCLASVFDLPGVRRLVAAFTATTRNGPMQEFLESFTDTGNGGWCVRVEQFREVCPALYHQVQSESE